MKTAVHTAAAASGNWFSQNSFTILIVVVLIVMVLFTVRNSRKRKADAEDMKSKLVPGAEIMTSQGIYGTLVSVDDEKNEAIIETTPGTRLRVHRQTLSRVVEPTDATGDSAETDTEDDTPTGAPEFGERVSDDEAPKKPGEKSAE